MIIAGLTGSIATGKSSVCSIFKSFSVPIIDADCIAKEIVRPDEYGWQKVVNCFGDKILLSDRSINREKLRGIIFNDKKARDQLDRCLHPMIISKINSEIKSFKNKSGVPLVIADVPLLFECGMIKMFDRIILVYTDRETQIKRLMNRNALKRADAVKRIDSQMEIDKKRELSDIIIDNQGTLDELKRQVRAVYDAFQAGSNG